MNSTRGVRRLVTGLACLCIGLASCGVSGDGRSAGRTTTPQRGTTTSVPSSTTSTPPGDPGQSSSWVPVKDTPSGLTFRLPKQPSLLNPKVTAPDGAQVAVRGYQVLVSRDLLVQVSIYDLAGRSFDADKAIDGVASTASGTVSARTHTASGDLHIVDAKIKIPSRSALGYDRVFKIGDHAVQMWTVGSAADEAQIRSIQQRLSASFRAA
jgi:hypothetical protein